MNRLPLIAACIAGLTAAAAAPPAVAQYKIVGPDGSITYTDRPPTAEGGKVSSLGRTPVAAQAQADSSLPIELRQLVARYPVTLYAGADCVPCENARQMLQQRGIPYAERRIAGEEDAAALERLVGGRTIPSLTVGAQPLRGFSQADWASFLDAAGYPRESRLPRGWQPAPPTPLTERAPPPRPAAATEAPTPRVQTPAPVADAPPNPSGIRF